MTSRYQIVTNTATQTATIVSESPILAWYQARIGDSDTIVTGLPTLDTIVAHNCQIVNRLDTIVTHNCNDAVWVGPNAISILTRQFSSPAYIYASGTLFLLLFPGRNLIFRVFMVFNFAFSRDYLPANHLFPWPLRLRSRQN